MRDFVGMEKFFDEEYARRTDHRFHAMASPPLVYRDMAEIQKYIMMTPGLVINEKVAHQGKPLPNVEKIKALIKKVQE
mgnify:CR=1 FL=1